MTPHEPEIPAEVLRPRGGRRTGDVRRFPRPGRWILIGIAAAFFIGVVGVMTFTQTRWGRAQILGYTLQALGGRLNGQLTIARLEGNVLTGARLYELTLTDHDGVPLAVVDSAYIRYRVATFLGGDIVITRVVAWNADIQLLRMPGDTAWNYQEILRDPDPDPAAGPGGATLIERLRLEDSRILIRNTLERRPDVAEAEWEVDLAEMLADTVRFEIEAVPGGYLQTQRIDVAAANVRELFVGPDERGGIYLEIDDALADVRLWRDPPLEVRSLRAQLHLQEGIVNFRAPEVVLPNSRGEVVGRIDLRGDRPMYDVVVTAPEFVLADMRWFYPWLPEDPAAGRGSMRLWVEDRPDDLLVLARDLTLEMPGTRLVGEFGLLVSPEAFRFINVDLAAEPLDLSDVDRLFPADLPVRGLVIGGAEVRGES